MSARRAKGFSLIEFMVSVVLGLVLISGLVAIYLGAKRSYTETEQVAQLSEHGRFAVQMLTEALRHVGFFGAAHPRDIVLDGNLGAVAGDCAGLAGAYEVGSYLLAATAASGSPVFGCVPDARTGTEVLLIKHVLPDPRYDADPDNASAARDGVISFPTGLDAQDVYVIANSERGVLLDGADTAPDVREGADVPLGVAWPYRVQMFYIRDNGGELSLSRRVLGWNAGAGQMELTTEELVPGAEDLRFRFGVDANAPFNGEVDTWMTTAGAVAAGVWGRVEAVEISLLLRSLAEDPGYEDNKSYELGGVTVTPGGNWRRLLVQNKVSMRNPKLTIRGGL